MKYIFEEFKSMAAFVGAITERKKAAGAGYASEDGDKSFRGTESYEVANKLAIYGDKNTAEQIGVIMQKMQRGNMRTEQRVQPRRVRSVVGGRAFVPAAIMGHPLSMIRREVQRVQRPVANVFYNAAASCGVSAERLARFGAKVCAAIIAAERAGVRVNLYAGSLAYDGKERTTMVTRVKDSDHDFDLLRMAYALANPSFLRRHWLRWIETRNDLKQSNWCDGYGRPAPAEDEGEWLADAEKCHGLRFDCSFSYATSADMTAEEMAKKILNQK